MSDLDKEYDGWYNSDDFKRLMQETTANLKKLTKMQTRMRFQFGEPEWYLDFTDEMAEANGWMSSWC